MPFTGLVAYVQTEHCILNLKNKERSSGEGSESPGCSLSGDLWGSLSLVYSGCFLKYISIFFCREPLES